MLLPLSDCSTIFVELGSQRDGDTRNVLHVVNIGWSREGGQRFRMRMLVAIEFGYRAKDVFGSIAANVGLVAM